MIRCLAPLPEGLANPVLDRMLKLAPYQAPSKEDEGGNKEAARRGISTSVKEDNQGEESDIPSPRGRKRTTSEDLETKVSKRENKSSPEGPALEGIRAAQCPHGDQPSTEP